MAQLPAASADDEAGDAESAEESRDRRARLDMVSGAFVVLAGVAITIATYALAWSGGVYLVAWGPMVYGLILFLRGLSAAKA